MNYKTAQIARQTLVDVATLNGSVGCISSISSRKGVRGANVSISNPLCYEDSGWYPLTDLSLSGNAAREIVNQYL